MAGLFQIAAAMGLFLAALAGIKLALEPAARLRIELFKPWRRDPWPIGVQEDDDARFDWRVAARSAVVAIPSPPGPIGRFLDRFTIAEAPPTPAPDVVDLTLGTLEDGADEPVDVQRLNRVSVRRPRS